MEGDYNIHIHTNTATHYFPYNKCTCDHSCIDDCITSLVTPGVVRELCMTLMLYVFQHFAFTGPIPYSASLQLTSCLSPVPFLVPILVWTILAKLDYFAMQNPPGGEFTNSLGLYSYATGDAFNSFSVPGRTFAP